MSWISATRLATYVLRRWGDVFTQCKTIVESHQNIVLLVMTPKTSFTSWYNRANNNAPQSSSRGMVIGLNGAIRDLAHIIILWPPFHVFRWSARISRHRIRHYWRRKIRVIGRLSNPLLICYDRRILCLLDPIVEWILTTLSICFEEQTRPIAVYIAIHPALFS